MGTEIAGTIKEVSPALGLKMLQVWTTENADENEVVKVNLKNHGIGTLYNVLCQVHTTDNSVIVTEAATTAVSNGVLTITFPGSNDAKKRSALIVGA